MYFIIFGILQKSGVLDLKIFLGDDPPPPPIPCLSLHNIDLLPAVLESTAFNLITNLGLELKKKRFLIASIL